MTVSLMDLLHSYTQLGVYSRIQTPGDRMQRFFGMQPGGMSENKSTRGRMFMFRYFDQVRDAATFKAPSVGPAPVTRQALGQVSGTFARVHESITVEYEMLGNLQPIDLSAPLDPGGQQYLTKQQAILKQRQVNAREIGVAGALRGSLGFKVSGENLLPVWTGGDFTIDFQVPAANKGNLGGILGATWSNAGTNILDDLVEIEQKSEEQTGRPVRHVWTDSTVWNHVVNNTQIKNVGGSSATPYLIWEMKEEPGGPEGKPVRHFEAILKAYPHWIWHIYNAGLNIDGTYTRFFDGTQALFVPDPDPDWFEMGVGSEYVVENIGMQPVERRGFHPWGKTIDEPAAVKLMTLDNFMPFLYVPKCVMFGTVVF